MLKLEINNERALGGSSGRTVLGATAVGQFASVLPPLVIKIALETRKGAKDQKNEAYTYEAMHSCQGYSVPIFYGRYTCPVRIGIKKLDSVSREELSEDEELENASSAADSEEDDSEDNGNNEKGTQHMSLLLFERVGQPIPRPTESEREEVGCVVHGFHIKLTSNP